MLRTAAIAALFSIGVTGAALAQPVDARGNLDAPACLPTNNITTTEALDRDTVLIHMSSGDTYSSHVASPCDGLRPKNPVTITKSADTQLCSGRDAITVEDRGHCTLGRFMPFHDRQPAADVRNPSSGPN